MSDALIYGPSTASPALTRKNTLRRPRAIVTINGVRVTCLECIVTQRTHFTSDEFVVHLEPWQQLEGYGIDYWSGIAVAAGSDVTVEISIGMLTSGANNKAQPENSTSLIIGVVDDVEIDPLSGKLIITGRDLSGRLIDTRTTKRWPDLTASQIVEDIANEFQLTPRVTATTEPAGIFYDSQYNETARDRPVWDIVVFLAEHEHFDAYVHGKVLYFGPAEADLDPNPWPIICQRATTGVVWSNMRSLILRRSISLAKDFSVTVRSHNPATGKSVIATAARGGGHHAAPTSASGFANKRQNYVYDLPGLTLEAAQKEAEKRALDQSKFERTVDLECEGDQTLTVARRARLTGTHSTFDQDYTFVEIAHAYSLTAGLTLKAKLKNHAGESQPII